MIQLYIPAYNAASQLKNLSPPFPTTLIDNGSSDHTLSLAKEKGWEAISYPHTPHRVDNWKRAVDHFLKSPHTWCKWLFTGDTLYQDAQYIYQKAIQDYPEARLIIAEYDILYPNKKERWGPLPTTRLLQPTESLLLLAKQGNIFGAPLAHCFHREAVTSSYDFGTGTWTADMTFCLHIASQFPVLYLKECIGAFSVEARKVYSSQMNALSSSIEEHATRLIAAQKYAQLMNDPSLYPSLESHINEEMEERILERSFARKKNWKNMFLRLIHRLLK